MQVKAMLTQIEQRHSEMQELEKSMLDLYQVFLDMSVVVAEQGEMLDRIEGWVRAPIFACMSACKACVAACGSVTHVAACRSVEDQCSGCCCIAEWSV